MRKKEHKQKAHPLLPAWLPLSWLSFWAQSKKTKKNKILFFAKVWKSQIFISAVLSFLSSVSFPRYWNLSRSFRQLSVIDNKLVWLQRPAGTAGCGMCSSSSSSSDHFKCRAVHQSLPQLCLNMQQVLENAAFRFSRGVALWVIYLFIYFIPPPPLKLCLQGHCLFFFFLSSDNWKVSCKQHITNDNWEIKIFFFLFLRWFLMITRDLLWFFSEDAGFPWVRASKAGA